MFTSLYLTAVLPASSPSALLNTMVMVGPSLRMRWIAIPSATTAARIGMSHTTEMRVRRCRVTVASGRGGSSTCLAMVSSLGPSVPDQARIERLGRHHRQHHHRREEQHAGTRLDR